MSLKLADLNIRRAKLEMQRLPERYLSYSDLLQLKRLNTPTIYNGWEQITRRDSSKKGFNLEPCTDFMPQMGPMIGYAVTVIIEPSNRQHQKNQNAWQEYRSYVASIPFPKIVVVQDLDKPAVLGAFWGEVNSNIHRALGCVGTITDGSIRDLDEMTNAGFKTLARRLSVGHAFSTPVRWNCSAEVFGVSVEPDQLIHADKHGFLVVPREDERLLLEAARFMDANESNTVIAAGRQVEGKSMDQILRGINRAEEEFAKKTKEKFGGMGK